MERWGAKVIALFITFISILITTLLPIKLYAVVTRFGSKGEHLIGCLMCFSGGVFLGAYMLHMAPEVRNLFDEALFHPNRITYPVADCVMVAGFFMMIFFEILVRYLSNTKKRSNKSETSNDAEFGLNDLDEEEMTEDFEDEFISQGQSSDPKRLTSKRAYQQQETLSQKIDRMSDDVPSVDEDEKVLTIFRGINLSSTIGAVLPKRFSLYIGRKGTRQSTSSAENDNSDDSLRKKTTGRIGLLDQYDAKRNRSPSDQAEAAGTLEILTEPVSGGLFRVESVSTREEGFDETYSQDTNSTINNLTVSSVSTRLYDLGGEREKENCQDDLKDEDSGYRMIDTGLHKHLNEGLGHQKPQTFIADVEILNELTGGMERKRCGENKTSATSLDDNRQSNYSVTEKTGGLSNVARESRVLLSELSDPLNTTDYESMVDSRCDYTADCNRNQPSCELYKHSNSQTSDDSVFDFNISPSFSAPCPSSGATPPPLSPGVLSMGSPDSGLLSPGAHDGGKPRSTRATRGRKTSKRVTIDASPCKPRIFGYQLVNGVRIPLTAQGSLTEDLEKIDEELHQQSSKLNSVSSFTNSLERISEQKKVKEIKKKSSGQQTVKETTACKEYNMIKLVGNKAMDRSWSTDRMFAGRGGQRRNNDQFGQHSQDPGSLTLLLALSLHNVFEGLSVGLKHSVNSVWNMCIAVVAHEIIIAFGLGMQMVRTYNSLRRMVFCALLCSSMVPLGVVIGLMITETGGLLKPSRTSLLTNGTLQGLATGVFIYVTFFEILRGEMGHGKSGMDKMFFMMFGFIALALLALLPEDTPMHLLGEEEKHGDVNSVTMLPTTNFTK